MTPKDLEKLYAEVQLEEEQNLLKDKERFAAGERNGKAFYVNSLVSHSRSSDYLTEYQNVDTLISYLEEFKEEAEAHKKAIDYRMFTDYDFEDGSSFRAYVNWKTIRSSINEQTVNYKFKRTVSDLLKPKTVLTTRLIDCKFLKLFQDGNIDWETLRQLVYSDCKL